MASKKKAAKRARTTKDPGMGPLLDLLKSRPELVHALVFDHVKVERLLRSPAARRLVPGVDTRKMQSGRRSHAHFPRTLFRMTDLGFLVV